ncbi:MAG TPA: sigma-70 family RNA polymerase sigma factor [Blastocatellia bacterium]|nr:sigma-70 family RNA polymerase sigma factor [Blastocatellia bacterium]
MTALKMNPTPDEELLQQMLAGDEGAFIVLYRRWQASIYRFALRMCGSEALAEDVTQEVFMILMREGSRYDASKGSLSAYLYGIARFQVLRKMQRERAMVSMDDEESEVTEEMMATNFDPLLDLTRAETVQSVRDAIGVLPVHYREVVVLCELHELSYADAAAVLGCAIGTVRSRLHRARGLLVEKLRPVAARDLRLEI